MKKAINVVNRQGDFIIVDGGESLVINYEGDNYVRMGKLDDIIKTEPTLFLDHRYAWFNKHQQTLLFRDYSKPNGQTTSAEKGKLTLLEHYGIVQGNNALEHLKDIDPAQWSKEEQRTFKNAYLYYT